MMTGQRLIDPTFWKLPLDERMAELIPMRAAGPFVEATFENIFTGATEDWEHHYVNLTPHAGKQLTGRSLRRVLHSA